MQDHACWAQQSAGRVPPERENVEKVLTEKDLGITVSNNLTSSAHVGLITAKANNRVGIIKRNFSVLSKEILVPLYLSLVCPILGYGAESWSSNQIQDTQSQEQVQRTTTKLILMRRDVDAYISRHCRIEGLEVI